MRQFDFDFYCFFVSFWIRFFFVNGFSNPFIVRSRSSFRLVNENSLNCTSGLVLLCFFNFTGVIFEAGNETRVKKLGVILALNKSEERSRNRVVFVQTAVFERARN